MGKLFLKEDFQNITILFVWNKYKKKAHLKSTNLLSSFWINSTL